jgi:protein-S-isoprenylcysteine O-methyltransferase Ste14
MMHPTTAGNFLWSAAVAARSIAWTLAGKGAAAESLGAPGDFLRRVDPGMVIYWVWLIWLAIWIVAAFGRKRAEKRQPRGERLVHFASMVFAAYLLYKDQSWFPALNLRFMPMKFWVAEVSMWATILGAAFAIWARFHLGKNWSGEVTIREDHKLIRSGPYTYIRHPIYTGMLLALAGTALAIGEYRALLGFAIFAVGLVLKARREEAMLAQEFGPSFEEHKKLTGFFLPRFS